MKKEAVIFLSLLFFLSLNLASAQSIDDSIAKITHYAEEYETGNINYAQLLVYTSSSRQDLAEAMGSTGQEHDATLTAEQLKSSLGEPQEYTSWAWVESGNGGHEKKMDKEIPSWKKIIFDGNKIQMHLEAHPNIILRNDEEKLVYRLNFNTEFKRPQEQLNIEGKISDIQLLAKTFSSNPSDENAEDIAKESVNAEKNFEQFLRQNGEDCEATMNEIFGSENRREDQKVFVQEIEFFEEENFIAKIRFEMCDDCEYNWISSNMWFEGRGNFNQPHGSDFEKIPKDRFMEMSFEEFEVETTNIINQMKTSLEQKNYDSAFSSQNKLQAITEAWNEQSNKVGKQSEEDYKINWESMTQEEQQKCQKEYCWIKKEQERREAERELRKENYEKRKAFYLDLFAEYDKKEFSFEQKQWEKRLVEEFKEFGKELCDNNIDDNNNEQIDCGESQCGGKICGYETVAVENNETNQTTEEKRELYCIANTCQAKEKAVSQEIICGNHLCEEGEQETCSQDCATCLDHAAIECKGEVIFSGQDENGCPLAPVCLAKEESCEVDADCTQPLCANAGCVEGLCKVTEFIECAEPQCVGGEQKTNQCSSGKEVIVEECLEGVWRETGVECEEGTVEVEEVKEEIVGDECVVKGDCGNENDVCSNGRCVTIPESVEEQSEDSQEPEEEAEEIEESIGAQEEIPDESKTEEREPKTSGEEAESQEETPEITGNFIFSFFRGLVSNMKITGFSVEDGSSDDSGTIDSEQIDGDSSQNDGSSNQDGTTNEGAGVQESPGTEQNENYDSPSDGNFEENRDYEEREDREEDERERRESECGDRCERECYDMKVRPCTEKCIWEECGNELECNVDEIKESCEDKCVGEVDIDGCESECSDKCLAGENTWKEPEQDEHKEEKGVFNVGGSCRIAQGKTEGFIWFGGWGTFQDIQPLKNKYYQDGESNWCKQDFENLIKQRKELEKSLNEEFARWFFEQYVANAADDWDKHISGIFEIYWRDVDLSRQMAERMSCLEETELPHHNLINFKYETEYGGVEFWEEIKTTSLNKDGKEASVISPYMKISLFPSRDFYKSKMKEFMETHKLPGPENDQSDSGFSEEEKRELREDEKLMSMIREFNEKYGENLVIQLKDFQKEEVVFNVYGKLNEEQVMYFEPMLPSEVPAEDVRVELDIEKLLDIVEFEENGRVELQSPPWDQQPQIGTVKKVTSGVKMYFMFNSLIDSARVYPASAEGDAIFFVKEFFDKVMNSGNEHEEEREGPGGCKSEEECTEYCEKLENGQECEQFRDENEKMPEGWEDKGVLTGEVINDN